MKYAEIVTTVRGGVPIEVVHFYDRLYAHLLGAVALVIKHPQVLF